MNILDSIQVKLRQQHLWHKSIHALFSKKAKIDKNRDYDKGTYNVSEWGKFLLSELYSFHLYRHFKVLGFGTIQPSPGVLTVALTNNNPPLCPTNKPDRRVSRLTSVNLVCIEIFLRLK